MPYTKLLFIDFCRRAIFLAMMPAAMMLVAAMEKRKKLATAMSLLSLKDRSAIKTQQVFMM